VKEAAFKAWLSANYTPNSAATHISSVRKVESAYGDLDQHYDAGELESIASEFNYSTQDKKSEKPNPTKIQTGKNLYENLASFKSGIRCYKKFRDNEVEDTTETAIEIAGLILKDKREGKTFELEAHLQRFLREEIEQLEQGLVIVDGGAERSVNSGEIDILAQDANGKFVVIELKRDLARRETIGQVTGYMGDIMDEESLDEVRGIIVAGDFDKSCRSALRAIPNLTLKKYRFSFQFEAADKG